MVQEVRTRFAPSPTGHLHIGGVRTALFNWLYAKKNSGKFILRIEDTDRERSKQEFTDSILSSLRWLGLDWDEGPYYQSQRNELYKEAINKLIAEGKVYRCICTKEELEERRKQALKEGRPPAYDRRCREAGIKEDCGKPFTLRFAMPLEGETVIDDLIRGRVVFQNKQLDDLIIARPDGAPTYNLVVVVDDSLMNINYVIRGEDHLANTPKQIQIMKALGYPIPVYAHLPLILGTDKARLSKRHGATSAEEYKRQGYLPEALINYLVRLGWSYGDKEIFTIDEMIRYFDIKDVSKAAGIFNPEKLLWMNATYIHEMDDKELLDKAFPFLKERGYDKSPLYSDEYMLKITPLLKVRSRTLVEFAESAGYFFTDEIVYNEKDLKKWIKPGIKDCLEELMSFVLSKDELDEKELEDYLRRVCEEKNIKLVNIAQPVRIALTGKTVSPGLFEVMKLIGKDSVAKRLKRLIDFIS
ncbi:MAG: glutamate--tRNA ligase [Candidatus Schekmanbacteria bacterium]|nr:MAG: glutamate--tRNA ligase [Candidatus Schekmanbacteria bacterium]